MKDETKTTESSQPKSLSDSEKIELMMKEIESLRESVQRLEYLLHINIDDGK